jgi:hypothetical protein
VEFAKACHKLAAEDAAEDFDGQKEVGLCGDPALVVGAQSPSRDDAVNMGMVQQLLIPGVQHAEKSDLCAQVFGIAGDLEQSLGAGAELCSPADYVQSAGFRLAGQPGEARICRAGTRNLDKLIGTDRLSIIKASAGTLERGQLADTGTA